MLMIVFSDPLIPLLSLFPVTINNSCDNAVYHMVEIWLAQETVSVGKNIVDIELVDDVGHEVRSLRQWRGEPFTLYGDGQFWMMILCGDKHGIEQARLYILQFIA